ncbi:hypothetical protein I5L01_06600 [Erythrobacter sp. YJ-T3-07]|uniref:hypothetical protein n=1 Tax=Erythrobacter sp. YJ-T3-07 TaxID=2793063 RepID=UPI0018D3D546|nr:hypothetical protein [Erythrobacter sp. YJ-T3-07]MBH1943902.1 hypothetical protein [Erythrobacter sp. YJ-T3-07]
MIAFAITCLLVATIIVALLSATDSLLRGARHYRALAAQLRTLRADNGQASGAATITGGNRPAPSLRTRRKNGPHRAAPAGLRAAA